MTIAGDTLEGLSVITLGSAEDGVGVEASFVPGAGMIGCSLRHRGEELLGQRGGLRRYIDKHSTMGIPLLYPWANRLSSWRFPVAGREVVLDAGPPAPSLDDNGLPIHGLLAADGGWQLDELRTGEAGGDVLGASLDLAARPDLMAAFPFPHLLRIEAAVTGSRLTIATSVIATGDRPVPIAFGFHPYLCLPGVDRRDWEIEVPVRERLVLDDRMLPTAQRAEVHVATGRLGSRTFDDGYVAPENSAPFVLTGGGRRISLWFESGYPYAQVFAPPDDDVIAFEPMTAPTNALVTGGPELRLLAPGERYDATFAIEVG